MPYKFDWWIFTVSRKENETAEDLEAGPSLKMGGIEKRISCWIKIQFNNLKIIKT